MLTLNGLMGSDLTVVNAARASYGKASTVLGDKDRRLIHFLARNGHSSPFRHAVLRFVTTSTLEGRIVWETAQTNTAGQVFRPTLAELITAHPFQKDEPVGWRWTTSLEAACRFAREFEHDRRIGSYAQQVKHWISIYFPVTAEALLGTGGDETGSDPQAPQASMHIPVLDRGYVRLVQYLDGPTDDERVLTLEIKAPYMVRGQWFKHRCDAAFTEGFVLHPDGDGNGEDGGFADPLYARNEMSRRYVTSEPEWYVPAPDEWRSAPESGKQGSSGPLRYRDGAHLTHLMNEAIDAGLRYFENAIQKGAAMEQARILLPGVYGMYSTWYLTQSVTAAKRFLAQRLDEHAQWEIRQYAQAVNQIIKSVFAEG